MYFIHNFLRLLLGGSTAVWWGGGVQHGGCPAGLRCCSPTGKERASFPSPLILLVDGLL